MPIYFSKKIESRPSLIAGYGSFAIEPILKDEIVIDFSSASEITISKKEADTRYKAGFDYMLQVGDDAFLITVNNESQKDFGYVNHSCDPNCGIKNKFQFIAMRDIAVGEEITFDYAMSESTQYSFACHCQSALCRGTITGDDWKLPESQKRYRGFFSDYIKDKIASLL